MNETALRWKGRISSLRQVALLVGLFAVIGLFFFGSTLLTAVRNADGPQDVTISQLVNGDFGSGHHVRVSGVALYDTGYEETDEDGTPTRNFYFLIHPDSGDMVLIQHPSAVIVQTEPADATITGMTRRIFSDLKSAMREDEDLFEETGVQPSYKVFVRDGDTPPSTDRGFVGTIASAGVLVLCLIPYLFPALVYHPHPIDPAAPLPAERPGVHATGRFTQLAQLEPTIEMGTKRRKFDKAVANVIPLQRHALMIYIHHILKSKVYGVTVRSEETDWAIIIDKNRAREIEPGKVYGWKERWAIRFAYGEPGEEAEELYLLVEAPGDQRGLVLMLERMGFSVTSPMPAI